MGCRATPLSNRDGASAYSNLRCGQTVIADDNIAVRSGHEKFWPSPTDDLLGHDALETHSAPVRRSRMRPLRMRADRLRPMQRRVKDIWFGQKLA